MRHGAGQVQTGRRIVAIVHDVVGEEGAAGGGLRWESEMGRRRKEVFARLDWSLNWGRFSLGRLGLSYMAWMARTSLPTSLFTQPTGPNIGN